MKKTTPDFISYPSKSYNWLMWIGGIGFLYPTQLFFKGLFVEGYLQFGPLFGVVFFLFFSLLFFYVIFGSETHFFYQDRLVSKSFFDYFEKTIFYKDIERWTEIEKENKHTKWTDLRIYTKNNSACFTSTMNSDYKSIRKRVIKGKKRDVQAEKNWFKRNTIYYCIGFALFGLGVIALGYRSDSDIPQKINFDDLKEITGIVERIEIEESSGRRGRNKSYWLEIELKNHPKFTFELNGNSYRAANISSAISKISVSDKVSVYVSKNQYEMKISKTKPPDFWTKRFYDFRLGVYQLEHRLGTYLNLKNYNIQKSKSYRKGKNQNIWVLLFGGGFICAAGYIYWVMLKDLKKYKGSR